MTEKTKTPTTQRRVTEWFGSSLDHNECELLTIDRIDRKLYAAEPELYERKWFDYRKLHPAQATYLMVHHYNRAFGDFLRRAVDVKLGFVSAITGKDFMATKERNSFWRLRQLIDSMGLRYDFFLRHAMLWHIKEGFGKGVQHPPRPAHMLDRGDMVIYVANAWSNERRARIQFAHTPRFTVPEWIAAPDQVAYQANLIAQIKRRSSQQYALHAALYVEDALRIEAAVEHFTPEIVTQAQLHCVG